MKSGKAMPMLDPMVEKLRERAQAGSKDPRPLLAMREVFSEPLANAAPFVDEVSAALRNFYENGAKATLAKYAEAWLALWRSN
jgi:mannitol 2-dehydrogenase